MIKKLFTLNSRAINQLNELKVLTGLSHSDLVRRAIELLFEKENKNEKKSN